MNSSEDQGRHFDFGYKPIGSASAYLRSSMGQGTPVTKKRVSQKEVLSDVLWEINKTSNLIQNNCNSEKEQKLKVYFSDGSKTNDFLLNEIFISPDVLRDEEGELLMKGSPEFFSAVDALNGQVLLCSQMKRHACVGNVVAEYRRIARNEGWPVKNIFITDLQRISLKELSQEWPGFHSYIEELKKKFFRSKTDILSLLRSPTKKKEDKLANLFHLLCYNQLNENQIDFDHYFHPTLSMRLKFAQKYLTSKFNESIEDAQRLIRAEEIAKEIERILDLPSLHNNEQEVKQNIGSQSEDSEDDEDDQKDDSQPNGRSKPSDLQRKEFTGDNSFNNDNPVSGDDLSGKLSWEKIEGLQKNKRTEEQIKILQNELLDNVSYQRIEVACTPLATDEYYNIIRDDRFAIRSLQNCFQFRNTEFSVPNYGLPSGELDDGSFYKVHFGDYEHLHERKVIKSQKRWLTTLMLDQSGSMEGPRWHAARRLSIIFSEAIKSLRGIDLSVYGFCSDERHVKTFCYKDKKYNRLDSLCASYTDDNTALGYGIGYVADNMLFQNPDIDNKIMFVITDGEPTHYGSAHYDAIEHTSKVCKLVRSKNIKVFGIGICNAFSESTGIEIFGEENFVVINNVESCLNVLTRALTRFLKQLQ